MSEFIVLLVFECTVTLLFVIVLGQSDDAVELTGWSIRFTPAGCGGPPLGFPKFVLLGTRKYAS